jgi:hypothetical protein
MTRNEYAELKAEQGIKWRNATFRLRQGYDGQAGRFLKFIAPEARPEVTFHLLRMHESAEVSLLRLSP